MTLELTYGPLRPTVPCRAVKDGAGVGAQPVQVALQKSGHYGVLTTAFSIFTSENYYDEPFISVVYSGAGMRR